MIGWIEVIGCDGKDMKVRVNVESMDVVKGILGKVGYMLLGDLRKVVRLVGRMGWVDNLGRGYWCDVKMVKMVGVGVIMERGRVKMEVKGWRVGMGMEGRKKEVLWGKKCGVEIEMEGIFGV